MKFLLNILITVALIGGAFLYVKSNPEILLDLINANESVVSTGETVVDDISSSQLFVNEDWFTKQDISWLKDFEGCKNTGTIDLEFETCDSIKQKAEEMISADYFIAYSGFNVFVLDTSSVTGQQQNVLANGLAEFNTLGQYPSVLSTKILTNEARRNWNTLSMVVEIQDKGLLNADMCRSFISLEGQDGFEPVINIICKKGSNLIGITNRIFLKNDKYQLINSDIENLLFDFRKKTANTDNEQIILDDYLSEIETNAGYLELKNETIQNAINRFALN